MIGIVLCIVAIGGETPPQRTGNPVPTGIVVVASSLDCHTNSKLTILCLIFVF